VRRVALDVGAEFAPQSAGLGARRVDGIGLANTTERLDAMYQGRHALALREGRARIALDERSLTVQSLAIRGGEGQFEASGGMRLDDHAATLDWRAERLRLFNRPDRQLVVSGAGNGPIAAFVDALRQGLGAEIDVVDYAEHALGQGADASAVAYVETTDGEGALRWGVGTHPNIITASLRAVLSALGRRAR